MFKHVLWFWSIRERDEAVAWLKANFEMEEDECLPLSTRYSFYTSPNLTERQMQIIHKALNPRDFISEEM